MDEADRFVHAAVRAYATGSPPARPPADPVWVPRAVAAGILAPIVADAVAAGHRVPAEIEHLSLSVTARHLRTLHDLDVAGAALDRAGVSWAATKGPLLRDVVFQRPGVRDYTDLDLLVGPRDFRRALRALLDVGATLHPCDWDGARRFRTAEITLVLPHGTLLDLHWNLVNMGRYRGSFRLDSDELLARHVVRDVDGHAVRSLDDADLVLHTMLHACLSGGSTLRLLLDVQQAVRWFTGRSSMAVLTQRARPAGVLAPARVVLASATRHVDAGLASYRMGQGPPTPWTGLVGAVTIARPPSAPSVTSRTARRFFACTRPTSVGSLLTLSRLAFGRVRQAGSDQPEIHPRPTHPDDPGLQAWLQLVDAAGHRARQG